MRLLLSCLALLFTAVPAGFAADAPKTAPKADAKPTVRKPLAEQPLRMAKDIAAFEAADKTNPPPQHAVLLSGAFQLGIGLLRAGVIGDFIPNMVIKGMLAGIGISIAVNRNPACRAALVSEPLSAALAREHNDANVICLPARFISQEKAFAIVDAYLNMDFEGGRHLNRVNKIEG